MNAKHNLSMNRLGLFLVGVVLCAQPLQGQEFWHLGSNVAGLADAYASGKQAQATLFGEFTSGGFRTLSEGNTLWSMGAAAQAETHFRDLVMVGNFGFRQDFGSQMMGSMFTQPGYYPVDVLEFTPGSKSKQTYDIAGGLAWTGGSRFIPGFTARFQGINYAKRKDLRHTTYRQEVELTPSLLYNAGIWRAGASYLFEKTSEFIQAEQIGPAKAESYYAFLDKGIRYGAYHAWDGSGIHLSEPGVDRFPVQEITHGAALQFSLRDNLYADVEFRRGQGQVGEKGYTWFRFPSFTWDARILYSFATGGNTHRFLVTHHWKSTRLYESVIEKVSAGGVTTPSILGSNRVFSAKEAEGSITYTLSRENGLQLEAGVFIDRDNKLSTVLYPYADVDGGTHLFCHVQADIPLGQRWLLKTTLLAGGGAESEQMNMVLDEALGVSTLPFRMEEWWELEQEVSDAFRMNVGLALQYRLPRLPLSIEAGCDFTHAFNVMLAPGANRQTSYFKLEYNY